MRASSHLYVFMFFVWTLPVGTAFSASQKSQFEKYIDQIFPPKNRKKAESSISTLDKINGFARITGAFEGHHDYFLFRGEKSNYVVSVGYGCGPDCSQDFSIYEFPQKGKHRLVNIETICDFSSAKDFAKELKQKCLEGPSKFSNDEILTKKSCPFVWAFPKKGTTTQIFNVGNAEGIGFESTLKPEISLSWNGSRFIAQKTRSSEWITLDEKRFDELF